METMAKAIRAYVESAGGKVSAEQIKRHILSKYPDQWKQSTLQAHLYGCVVNNPKAYIHHRSADKFLYKSADGGFEVYSERTHGPNEWAPAEEDDGIGTAEELAETSISLERDIEDHLVEHLDGIEKGLKLIGRQVGTDVGFIDILAADKEGRKVIVELKAGAAKDSAIGQLARYLGWYQKKESASARGILIAREFPEGVRYAAAAIPNVSLVTYRVSFSFENCAL